LFRWFLDMDMLEPGFESPHRHVTPQEAQRISKNRGSKIDGRTTSPPGHGVSQPVRKRVEEVFG
jgi:hypothetical protein